MAHVNSALLVVVIITCVAATASKTETVAPAGANASEAFEREYRAYKEALKLDFQEFPYRSSSYGPRSSVCLHRIRQLGIQVLPNLIQKMAETRDIALNLPMHLITKKAFTRQEWREDIPMDSRGELQMYLDWWKTGRKSTARLFDERDSDWETLSAQGRQSEAQTKLEEIRSLGIAAIPLMVRKLKEGRTEFVPIISKLTDGKVDPNSNPSQCISWWENDRDKWLISFPNGRPTAKVGPDKTVIGGDTVQLDASSSSDPDGDELSYQWTQIAGPPVTLSDSPGANPTFVAAQVSRQTVLVFQLVVDDAGDLSKTVPTPNSKSEAAIARITVEPKK